MPVGRWSAKVSASVDMVTGVPGLQGRGAGAGAGEARVLESAEGGVCVQASGALGESARGRARPLPLGFFRTTPRARFHQRGTRARTMPFLRSSKPPPFAGDHVLITGGSAGLGLALARRFVAGNANVTLIGRSPDRLAAAAAELRGLACRRAGVVDPWVYVKAVDVTDGAKVRADARWRGG